MPILKIIALIWKILTNVNHLTTVPKVVLIPSDHINVLVAKGIFWILRTTLLAMV